MVEQSEPQQSRTRRVPLVRLALFVAAALAVILMAGRGPHASDATPPPARKLTVRWTTQLKMKEGDLRRIEELLDRPVDTRGRGPLLLVDDVGGKAQVTTPAEYLELSNAGYAPRTPAEQAKALWFKASAVPLLYMKDAKAARVSYVDAFDLTDGPLLALPAMLAPTRSGRALEGKTWKEAWPDSTWQVLGPSSILADTHEGNICQIQLLAWADFDGDGVEDMLLAVIEYAGGWSVECRHVVVTRMEKDGGMRVVAERQ